MPLYNQSPVCYELAAGNHIQSHQQPQPPSYLPGKKFQSDAVSKTLFRQNKSKKKKLWFSEEILRPKKTNDSHYTFQLLILN